MEPPYEEEIQLLLKALQTEAFRFVLIAYNQIAVYQDISQTLVEKFGRSRKVQEFSFKGKSAADIKSAIIRLHNGILLFRDVEHLLREENAALCVYFNQRRDFFAKQDIAYLFFIEPGSFKKIAQKLPDWWSLRSLELECILPVEDKQGLPSTWIEAESSPYANWTQPARDTEIERLQRLITQAEPEDLNLLGALFADLGELHDYSGQFEHALNYLEKALAIKQQIGDRKGEGTILNNLATIAHAKGDYDTALRYLEQSLAIRQQIGDHKGECYTLINLAISAHARGLYDTASQYLERASTISQEIGDRQAESAILNNLAITVYAVNDYDTALHYLKQALSIVRQIGDLRGESATLNNIGQIYKYKGDYDTALRYFEQSLAIQQQIGDRKGEGGTLNNISQIYDDKGDYDTALRYLEQSLAIRQQIGDIAGLAATLHNMGTIYLDHQDDVEAAIGAFMQAYQILDRLGSPNVRYPEVYLNRIIKRIGEARFEEIVGRVGE